MPERTHTFYTDHTLAEETELKKGDRIVFAGNVYCVMRNGQRLFCRGGNLVPDTEFNMGYQPNAVYGALDLAQMFRLSARKADIEIGGEIEWLLE